MTTSLNLESCTNKLSKFGYHQTTDRLMTDSSPEPNRLPTDSNQTADSNKYVGDATGLNLESRPNSSPNLESCSNQLSKFGYHQTSDRLLTKSQQTSSRLKLNPATEIVVNTRSQFGELFKSALQIWLPSDSRQTSDGLLTDF